ncbi:MAG: rhomboid family intramembrane serine protease [Rikenellaceae bacterium]
MFNQIKNSRTPVAINLIIVNCLGLMATTMFPILTYKLGLHALQSNYFMPYQVVSYMFLHGDLSHLFFNMFALWMFGRQLEYDLGPRRMLTYYMVCGVGAALIQLVIGLFMPYSVTVGASGAVFGLLLAFGVLHPNARIMLLIPPIPMKAKVFVVLYGLLELYLGWRNNPADNVAHFAHVGGMLWGLILLYYWKFKRYIYF